MKIKNIISSCKHRKNISVVMLTNENWLGDGKTLFLMPNYLDVESDSLFGMYDFSETEQEKTTYKISTAKDLPYCFDDEDDTETDVEIFKMSISLNGTSYCPISTDSGVMYIDERYFKVFSDKITAIKKRVGRDGKPYLAVKEGLILTGIIFPDTFAGPEIKKELELMAKSI